MTLAYSGVIRDKVGMMFIPVRKGCSRAMSGRMTDLVERGSAMLSGSLAVRRGVVCVGNSGLVVKVELRTLVFTTAMKAPVVNVSCSPGVSSCLGLVRRPSVKGMSAR